MSLKYCGYKIGTDINEEQLKRLFDLVHKEFKNTALIMLNDLELRSFAETNKSIWF